LASSSSDPIRASSSGSKNLAGVVAVVDEVMTGEEPGSSLLPLQKLEDFSYIVFHFSFFILLLLH
jgi:hypothetical protein